jgi:hypothetical protein
LSSFSAAPTKFFENIVNRHVRNHAPTPSPRDWAAVEGSVLINWNIFGFLNVLWSLPGQSRSDPVQPDGLVPRYGDLRQRRYALFSSRSSSSFLEILIGLALLGGPVHHLVRRLLDHPADHVRHDHRPLHGHLVMASPLSPSSSRRSIFGWTTTVTSLAEKSSGGN